jgi:hypothetical protein
LTAYQGAAQGIAHRSAGTMPEQKEETQKKEAGRGGSYIGLRNKLTLTISTI